MSARPEENGEYPQYWDVKLLSMLEKANPGGQTWDDSEKTPKKPFGTFGGKTVFEAAEKYVGPEGPMRVLGYLPTDQE